MALIDRYAQHANTVRRSIDEANDAGDPDTADIFTEVSRGLDKQLWFLEAHTQEPAGKVPARVIAALRVRSGEARPGRYAG